MVIEEGKVIHPWPLHYFGALDFVSQGVAPLPTCPVSAFYKWGCQEETLRMRLALRNSLRHPAC